jgi:hypothetical protein
MRNINGIALSTRSRGPLCAAGEAFPRGSHRAAAPVCVPQKRNEAANWGQPPVYTKRLSFLY